MVEEIEDLKDRLDQLESGALGANTDFKLLQSNIESFSQDTLAYSNILQRTREDLQQTQNNLKLLDLELTSFKKLSVCVVLLALCYKLYY